MTELPFPPGPWLHSAFEIQAGQCGDKTALVCGGQRLSYAQLQRQVAGLSMALADAGIGRGDRVLLFLENSAEFAGALHAVLRLGAVVVPVSPLTKAAKLAYLLADTGARALLTHAALAPAWADAARAAPELVAVWVAGTGSDGGRPWPAPTETPVPAPGPAHEDDLAALIYTSGTTGQPKGVMLSHANMRAAWRSVQAYLQLRSDDVIGLALQPAFSYGLYHVLMGLGLGATVVLERSVAFPVKLLQQWAAQRVTVFPGVPTLFASLLALDLAQHDLSSLRIVTNAAAALPAAHVARLCQAWPNVRFFAMYGLTECKRASYLPPEELERRPDSVGRGIPFQQHWLADEHGRPLPHGSIGELVLSGPHVMRGYWRRPDDTAQRLRPGRHPGEVALHTGDIFRSDADGWLYFVSRSDDIIKSRGEKVSPVEVEHAICLLPEVLDTAVVGVPDELLGQAVKAYVRLRPGAQVSERDVIRHCLSRLESFMAPKTVEFVAELPVTESGKVRRASLRTDLTSRPSENNP